jgi:N,N'-diacetyllegionaminate synthase
MVKTLIIAEAGVNHNGCLDTAKKMIDVAKEANVDIIKFQTFVTEDGVSKHAPMADYQQVNTNEIESQRDMVKKLELSQAEFIELKEYCDLKEIEFLSTAFDFKSVDFLKSLGLTRWKIPSGEITNLPYLMKIAKFSDSVILSTGMSTLEEVRKAIQVLKGNGTDDIVLLHCTTEYPAPFNEINLKAMEQMRKEFSLPVGYSDHTLGIEVPIAATALGASIVEKHFTLSKDMKGPDHAASIEPVDLKRMVSAIRNIEQSLGDGDKRVTKSEQKNIMIARKSIVAKHNICKGDKFTDENITVKRPGDGISPMRWFDVIGKLASRDFEEDEQIEI